MANIGNQGTAGFAEPEEARREDRWNGTDGRAGTDRLPPPLDTTALLGRLGGSAPSPDVPHEVALYLRLILWLLLAADAALAGFVLLVHPVVEGTWGDVVATATLGGQVRLTLWLALASTGALVGCALVTRGFARGTWTELGVTAAAGVAAAVVVGGAVLVLVLASSLFVLVGGLALLLFGAVTERDNRP